MARVTEAQRKVPGWMSLRLMVGRIWVMGGKVLCRL